jgi:hypothetical protein
LDPNTCEDCASDRNLYNPACLQCGPRLIRAIQAMRIPPQEKRDRCRKVLQNWMKYGHSEADIRRLASEGPGRGR